LFPVGRYCVQAMNTPPAPLSPAELLRELDARMTQALENFFQRSRSEIQDAIMRVLAAQMTPPALAKGQACIDWLNAYPDSLSGAFADQFRLHLARPETFARHHEDPPSELQLVDDGTLQRQLAEDKAGHQLTEALRADMCCCSVASRRCGAPRWKTTRTPMPMPRCRSSAPCRAPSTRSPSSQRAAPSCCNAASRPCSTR
jgi:hypothetical protein